MCPVFRHTLLRLKQFAIGTVVVGVALVGYFFIRSRNGRNSDPPISPAVQVPSLVKAIVIDVVNKEDSTPNVMQLTSVLKGLIHRVTGK